MNSAHVDVDEPVEESWGDALAASRRIAQRSLDVAANRVELLMVEAQEERDRLLRALYMDQ